jgi:hypothetical protein
MWDLMRREVGGCAASELKENLLKFIAVVFAGCPAPHRDNTNGANGACIVALPAVVRRHRPQGGWNDNHKGNADQASV